MTAQQEHSGRSARRQQRYNWDRAHHLSPAAAKRGHGREQLAYMRPKSRPHPVVIVWGQGLTFIQCESRSRTLPYNTLSSIFFNTSIALVVGKLAGEQPRILMLGAGALTRRTANRLRRLEPARVQLVRRLGSKMRQEICASDE